MEYFLFILFHGGNTSRSDGSVFRYGDAWENGLWQITVTVDQEKTIDRRVLHSGSALFFIFKRLVNQLHKGYPSAKHDQHLLLSIIVLYYCNLLTSISVFGLPLSNY